MPIILFNMNEIKGNLTKMKMRVFVIMDRKSDTRTKCLEPGPRCLKARQMCTEIRRKILEINANVYKDICQCS